MEWITLKEASGLENLAYMTMLMRTKSNEYNTKTEPATENGGRERVMVAVESLSDKAQAKYKRRKRDGMLKAERERLADEAPWYIGVDFGWYKNEYEDEWYEKVSLASEIEKFLAQKKERKKRKEKLTNFVEEYAKEHLGVSGKQLRRYVNRYSEGCKWALLYETEGNFDFYKILAICSPPQKGKGVNLTDEMKQLLRNLWADELYQKNNQAFTLLYDDFCDKLRAENAEYIPSYRTCKRFADLLEYEHSNVKTLIKHGTVGFRHDSMLKKKRDCKELQVMEVVQADAHTFDCWVEYVRDDGKAIAIRPYLVGMIDMRSRCLVGWGITFQPNAEVIKQVVIHMIYTKKDSPISGVPKVIYIDNGKDFTAETLTGRSRKVRFDFDSSTKGFYKSVGIEYDKRALPYSPWTKAQIERYFGTVCGQFSKRFKSYTGTLTGSKTDAKVKKDIQGMLDRGELDTMEEFKAKFEEWLSKYHNNVHDGLKEQGEPNPRPIEVFQNAERYFKAAPPYAYSISLLGKTEERNVTNVGIRVCGNLYTSPELGRYIGEKVIVRYNEADIKYITVYNAESGICICDAYTYEATHADAEVDDEYMIDHFKNQKKQLRTARGELNEFRNPFNTLLPELEGVPERVTAIPQDRQFVANAMAKKNVKKANKSEEQRQINEEFIKKQASKVYDELAKLG